MTVIDSTRINGTRPVVRGARKPLLYSALAVFTPKPRPADTATDPEPGRVVRWLAHYGRRVKETVVTTVVCGLPTVAAFQWHLWAGLVAAGIAVMIVDAVADPAAPEAVSPNEHGQ